MVRGSYSRHCCEDKTLSLFLHSLQIPGPSVWAASQTVGRWRPPCNQDNPTNIGRAGEGTVLVPVLEPGFWDVRGSFTLILLWKAISAALPIALTRKLFRELWNFLSPSTTIVMALCWDQTWNLVVLSLFCSDYLSRQPWVQRSALTSVRDRDGKIPSASHIRHEG